MIDYTAFSEDWEAAWNSHDLDRILAHYSPDVIFRSQKAMRLVGQGQLFGQMHSETIGTKHWSSNLTCPLSWLMYLKDTA